MTKKVVMDDKFCLRGKDAEKSIIAISKEEAIIQARKLKREREERRKRLLNKSK